jgi:hypothetical protein
MGAYLWLKQIKVKQTSVCVTNLVSKFIDKGWIIAGVERAYEILMSRHLSDTSFANVAISGNLMCRIITYSRTPPA